MTTRKRLALFLLCLASFIAVVDTTIVSIALPSMRRELGFTGADAQWILNGYALTFGGLVLLLGRAGDLYGRRRLFVVGLILFGAASLVGGFSWEPWILVVARFIQGVGAAALVPAPAVLPESRNERAPRSLDLAGALTATSGLGLLIYAISEVPENGWASTLTLLFGTLGALFMVCFVVAERRSAAPLVPLGVLKKPDVVVPNAAIFLQSMVGIAWLYVLTLYFQEVLGHSALTAGLLFIPMTLASVVAAPLAGRLATRLGVRTTATSGLVLVAVGLLLMTPMSVGGGLAFVL